MKKYQKIVTAMFCSLSIITLTTSLVVSCSSSGSSSNKLATSTKKDNMQQAEIKINYKNAKNTQFSFLTNLNNEQVSTNNLEYKLYCNNQIIGSNDYTYTKLENNENEIEINILIDNNYLNSLSINKYQLKLDVYDSNNNLLYGDTKMFYVQPYAIITTSIDHNKISILVENINPSDASLSFNWYCNYIESQENAISVDSGNIYINNNESSIIKANSSLFYYCIVNITSNEITNSITSGYIKIGSSDITVNN